ncbi:hypothetical protein B9J96_13515 [Enterobacter roggenkampii]|uniref:hypothetical protein n=1 Tax=Enterobacter roggenkampii TaxID=1812935 RepID=UPI000B562489|nr:hypothetical protein [Enterobacter roggenkampii]OUR35662.1 hypothetical protein B9J96_13515 [Enterobacter roggenkampii]
MFTGLKKSESKRLAALELLSKEDKSRDAALAEFARLACEVMGVEGCFITTFDDEYQYIKYVKNIPIEHVKGNDSNLLIVFYVQIMPDDFVMQLHRF